MNEESPKKMGADAPMLNKLPARSRSQRKRLASKRRRQRLDPEQIYAQGRRRVIPNGVYIDL